MSVSKRIVPIATELNFVTCDKCKREAPGTTWERSPADWRTYYIGSSRRVDLCNICQDEFVMSVGNL